MGLRDQSADFFALQRYELFIVVVPVELRTKIHGMNSRIIAFYNKKVRRLQQYIVLFYNLSFLR